MGWKKFVVALIAAIFSTAAHASADRPFGLAMDQQVSGLDILERSQRFVVLRSAPEPAPPFSQYVVAENSRGEVCRVIALGDFASDRSADAAIAMVVADIEKSYGRPELATDAILHLDGGAALVWRPLGPCSRDDFATEADIKLCRSAFPQASSGLRKVTLIRRDLAKPTVAVRYDFANLDGCPTEPKAVSPSEIKLKRR